MARILGCCLFAICLAACSINLQREDSHRNLVKVSVAYKDVSNELNTSDRTYRREIEAGHFAQTTIELTPEQQLLILNKALTTKFFTLPDTLTKRPFKSALPRYLDIQADSLSKRVVWYGDLFAPMVGSTTLPELMLYVDSIVSSTDAVKQLPPAHIGL